MNYQLSRPAFVQISIFNTLGEEVKTLINSRRQTGFYSVIWNGDDEHGAGLASGMYVCEMMVDGRTWERRKLILLK